MGYINLVCQPNIVTLDSSGSQMADKGVCPLDWGCRVIKRKDCPLTIVGNLYGEGHASYTLKSFFVDFDKE